MKSKDNHSPKAKRISRTRKTILEEQERFRPFKRQAASRLAELDKLSQQIMEKWKAPDGKH